MDLHTSSTILLRFPWTHSVHCLYCLHCLCMSTTMAMATLCLLYASPPTYPLKSCLMMPPKRTTQSRCACVASLYSYLLSQRKAMLYHLFTRPLPGEEVWLGSLVEALNMDYSAVV